MNTVYTDGTTLQTTVKNTQMTLHQIIFLNTLQMARKNTIKNEFFFNTKKHFRKTVARQLLEKIILT